MAKFEKPAKIENLADLKQAKKAARDDIQISLQKLDGTISDIPNRLLGGTVAIVGGAIAFGIVKRMFTKKQAISATKPSGPSVHQNLRQTLKNLGGKTALFVVTKLMDKLLSK